MEQSAADAVVAEYSQSRSAYDALAGSLAQLLEAECRDEGVEVVAIEARSKTPDSLRTKLLGWSDVEGYADVHDLCGVRVIVYTLDAVEHVVALIEERFSDASRSERDANPGAFGYSSTHVVVSVDESVASLPGMRHHEGLRAEIQVRTALQHAWAAMSHNLDYKSSVEVPNKVKRRLLRLAALIELGDEEFQTFQDEVTALRRSYREDVEEGSWRELELNVDSLEASFDRFDLDLLKRLARDTGLMIGEVEFEVLPRESWTVSTLLLVAREAGLETVGDLDQFIVQLPKVAPELKAFGERVRQYGFEQLNVYEAAVLLIYALILQTGVGVETLDRSRWVEPVVRALRELKIPPPG